MKLANEDYSPFLTRKTCEDCGQHIVWSKVYLSGRPIPLDPRPESVPLEGTEYVLDVQGRAHQVSRELCIFTAHQASCPERVHDDV